MSRHTCHACGREAHESYCGRCGADQSPAARRHWSIMHAHESAARTAVRKAEMDADLYDLHPCFDLPTVERRAKAVARELAREESNRLFPAVAGSAKGSLRLELVEELVEERLEVEE